MADNQLLTSEFMDKSKFDRRKITGLLPLTDQGRTVFFADKRFLMLVGCVVLVSVFLPFVAQAGMGKYIALALSFVFNYLAAFMGQLLLLLIAALIYIAQYNGFVTSAAVGNGWIIVRDIANMFFIIALLLIAFGTMLGLGGYHYSKTLPRLVIMAILVNFSRTICGLIIDFSQIVMLTFVHGFKEAAGGNFVNAFQIKELMEKGVSTSGVNEDDRDDLLWQTTIGMILAFVLLLVASGVVIVMITVLIVRIVYLWLLVVLSPLAFMASAVPIGRASQFYGRWWDNFNKQVIVGPFMAFFLWLALVSVSTDNFHEQGFPERQEAEVANEQASAAFGNEVIEKFIIGIALLLGGVAMAQEMSQGAVGAGKGIAKRVGRAGIGAAKLGARAAAYGAGRIPVGRKDLKTGRRMNLASFGTAAGARFRETGVYKAFSKEGRETAQKQREISALRSMGMGDAADVQQMKLVQNKAGSFGEKYSAEKLRKLSKDRRVSQVDRQGALMALAQNADSSLWGKGAKITEMVKATGGSKDLEKAIRLEMKKKGDKDALLKDGDDVKRHMASLNDRQRGNEMKGVDKLVEVDENGDMGSELALEKALTISPSTFSSFSSDLQEQIEDALLLASKIRPDRAAEIQTKYDAMVGPGRPGFAARAADADALKAKMDANVAGARAAKAKAGKLDESSYDLNVQRQLSNAPKPQRKTLKGAHEMIKDLNEQLARGVNAKALETKIQDAIDEMELSAAGSKVKVRDSKGNELNDVAALQQTTMYQDLQRAKQAASDGNGKQARKFMDAAAVSTGSTVRSFRMSPERRKSHFDDLQTANDSISDADITAGKLTSAATDKERRRHAKDLNGQIKALSSTMLGPPVLGKLGLGRTGGRGGTLSEEMRQELESLRQMSKQVKGIKKFTATEMGKVQALITQLNDVKKSLS